MQIQDLKQFLVNKVNNLEPRLSSAVISGDLLSYADIEKELAETKEALEKIEKIQ